MAFTQYTLSMGLEILQSYKNQKWTKTIKLLCLPIHKHWDCWISNELKKYQISKPQLSSLSLKAWIWCYVFQKLLMNWNVSSVLSIATHKCRQITSDKSNFNHHFEYFQSNLNLFNFKELEVVWSLEVNLFLPSIYTYKTKTIFPLFAMRFSAWPKGFSSVSLIVSRKLVSNKDHLGTTS